jgi:hypothetical protein
LIDNKLTGKYCQQETDGPGTASDPLAAALQDRPAVNARRACTSTHPKKIYIPGIFRNLKFPASIPLIHTK